MESNKCIKSRAKELSNEMLLACQSAAIGDFRNVTIKNKVKEINLKPIQVEYEQNINARYFRKANIFVSRSSEEAIYKKSNGNEQRVEQIVANANALFHYSHQYIVFNKELVVEINKWLDSLLKLSKKLKYGKLDDDISELRQIFPITLKEWLVIDGNSYFTTIHQIYIERNKMMKKKNYNKTLANPINYWSQFYKYKSSKGFAYTADILDSNEYIRDIQMLQLVTLILEKNVKSWDTGEINIFYNRLTRLVFAVTYKYFKNEILSDIFSIYQALKFLLLPKNAFGGKSPKYNSIRRIDAMTMVSLFGKTEKYLNEELLNSTTYNIPIFKDIINFLFNKRCNCMSFNYGMDCLNEIYQGMVNYQVNSIKYVPEGFNARDRLTKANKFCNKNGTNIIEDLKNTIISSELPISEVKNNVNIAVNKMIEMYKKYVDEIIKINSKSNEQIIKSYENLYNLVKEGKLSKDDFIQKCISM